MLHDHELNSNNDITNIREVADRDRKENAATHATMEANVVELRTDLIIRLRRSALEGLALAALGALLLASGDVLAALLPLVGM